jgi:HD-like signal output (HDOD) protein
MSSAPSHDRIAEKIERIANLPTLSPIVARMLDEVRKPEATAGTLAPIISGDIAMTARVLRVANSALFGMRRNITTVHEAVVVLGMRTIRAMVLSLTVFDIFPLDRVSYNFDRKKFWYHCIAAGIFAKRIAGREGLSREAQEEAFCVGLLHDLGKVIMEEYLHRDFHIALTYARDNGLDFFTAERSLLGYTHCDVAQWLTRGWALPEAIRLPLVYHHEPAAYRDAATRSHNASADDCRALHADIRTFSPRTSGPMQKKSDPADRCPAPGNGEGTYSVETEGRDNAPSAEVQTHERMIALCHVADWASYRAGFTTQRDDTPPRLHHALSLSRTPLDSYDTFIDTIGDHIQHECTAYVGILTA